LAVARRPTLRHDRADMRRMPVARGTPIPRFARLAIVVALCVSLLPMWPSAALAVGDGAALITSVSDSSFRLRPRQGRVDVVVTLAISNRIPTRGGVQTYIDHWLVYTPNGASRLKVQGAGVRWQRQKRSDMVTVYGVGFDRIFSGQTRRLRLTYRLPAAQPRSDDMTRITEAYSHFCWLSQPTDEGSVRAILPSDHEPTTRGSRVRVRRAPDGVVLSAMPRQDLARFIACTDSVDPSRLVTGEATTSAGRTVTVQGWREDPDWAADVTEGVGDVLPALEHLAGAAYPRDVVVREVATQALYGYGGEFDPRHGIIRIAERVDDPVLLAHELAHAWFNRESMAEDWMIEAHAEWLGRAANDYWCVEPGPYPGKGKPKLRDWRHLSLKPTKRERATVDYQYAAGCSLLETIEKVAGIEAVRDVNAALLARTPKYGGSTPEDAPKPDWREWLDAVDELALVPAGVQDLRIAEKLLTGEGIAKRDQLKGRAEARIEYHRAMAGSEIEFVPLFVRDAMDAWEFDKATKALAVAEEAMALAAAAGQDAFDVAHTGFRLTQASSLREVQEIRDELSRST
jgi:hypothetical protein